jgi:hypothetical protein
VAEIATPVVLNPAFLTHKARDLTHNAERGNRNSLPPTQFHGEAQCIRIALGQIPKTGYSTPD